MGTQITVRLTEDVEKDLDRLTRAMRLRRSDVVCPAIRRMADEMGGKVAQGPSQQVKDLLGSVESGVPDLGSAHREHLIRQLGHDA
jgi:Arc/MetJ-type ribon-helix-helix transcriptional regulator